MRQWSCDPGRRKRAIDAKDGFILMWFESTKQQQKLTLNKMGDKGRSYKLLPPEKQAI